MPLANRFFRLDSPVSVGHFGNMNQKSSKPDYDVLVIGAGLAGLAGALALADAGAQVCLCDSSRQPQSQSVSKLSYNGQSYGKSDPRVTALSPSSVLMLETLGVSGELRATPVAEMKVTAAHPDAGFMAGLLSLGAADPADGPLAFMLNNGELSRALLAAVKAHKGIELFYEVAAERVDIHDAHVEMLCANGKKFLARLLVGADGRNSIIRQQAGINVLERDYGSTAIVTTITHSASHEHIARQFFKQGGPLACLPLGKTPIGWQTSIVWPEQKQLAKALLSISAKDFQMELAARLDGMLGDIIKVAPPVSYPLGLMLAHEYVGARTALLGEAAHIIHPLAGQGYNLTLRDAAQLAEGFYDARRLGLDVGAPTTLALYNTLRQSDGLMMAAATHLFATHFSTRQTMMTPLRKALFSVANRLPFLQANARRIADTGLGPTPRLLRGEGFKA